MANQPITLAAIKNAAAVAGIELTEFVGDTYGIHGLYVDFDSKACVDGNPFQVECSVAISDDIISFVVTQPFFKDPIYHFKTIEDVVTAFQLYRDLVAGAGGSTSEELMKCVEAKDDEPKTPAWAALRRNFIGYREDLEKLRDAKIAVDAKEQKHEQKHEPEEQEFNIDHLDLDGPTYTDCYDEEEVDEEELEEAYNVFTGRGDGPKPDDHYQ